ncbi:MAG: hypothetical protein P8165_18825 [Deltaproteobacteria bacterium]
MTQKKQIRRCSALAVVFGFLSLWLLLPGAAAETMIQEGIQNDIPFASGGVGDEEQSRLRKMARQYNVKVVFAAMSGAYLMNAHLIVRNAQGRTVMDKDFGGPWVFMKLPRGDYDICADLNGIEKRRHITVGNRLEEVLFHWRK